MATEEQIQKVLNHLQDVQTCPSCGTRFRFGDLDCPHCGEDIEETLREWADRVVSDLT